MGQLRRTIAAAPAGGKAAIVTRAWLEQVEQQLIAGQAALAELEAVRAGALSAWGEPK